MDYNNLATGRPNVIITGAAGFIGTNLCERLIKTSNIIAVDNFSTGKQQNIDLLLQDPNFEFIRQDISAPFKLDDYAELKKFKIDIQGIQAIYNLACPTSPRDHEKYAMEILATNSEGLKNILDLALQYKTTFIHVSSQHIYGIPLDSNPIKEDYQGRVDLLGPRSAYDEGKRFAETLITNYQRKYNLNTKIARVFTTYGPKMSINDGRAIPDFILGALNNWDLTIYGDENTENTFCYVDDVIDGLIKIAKSNFSSPVNIGHYEKYKLKDVAELVVKLVGSKSKIIYQRPDWHGASYNIPDINLAKEKLGWFPLINIEDGLKKTIDFTKANIRLYQG